MRVLSRVFRELGLGRGDREGDSGRVLDRKWSTVLNCGNSSCSGGDGGGGGGIDHRPQGGVVKVIVVDGVGDWRIHCTVDCDEPTIDGFASSRVRQNRNFKF